MKSTTIRRAAWLLALILGLLMAGAGQAVEPSSRKLVGRPEFHSYLDSLISPDSHYLVFRAVQGQDERPALFSRALTGGATVRLSLDLGSEWEVEAYAISADASRIVYLQRDSIHDSHELYSVAIHGPASASVKLHGPPSAETDEIGVLAISPDSQWVLFESDLATDNVTELFRAPITGGEVTRISDEMTSGGDVQEFQITPDGLWVVYLADQEADRHDELFSVPLTGTGEQAALLNHELRRHLIVCMPSNDSGRDAIESFGISPDSGRVVYMAETIINSRGECDEVHELFSAPIDAATAAVLIQDSNDDRGFDVLRYQIGPNSAHVVYLYNEPRVVGTTTWNVKELYSVPIQGPPAAAVKLHPTLANDRDVDNNFAISLDPLNPLVVYAADREVQGEEVLYSVPISGGASPRLMPPLTPGASVDTWNYQISPDGSRVVYVVDMNRTYPDFALFSVPIQGPASAAVEISGPMVANGSLYGFVTRFVMSPDGRQILYRADQEVDEVYELYQVNVEGPAGSSIRLSGPMPAWGDISDSSGWLSLQP